MTESGKKRFFMEFSLYQRLPNEQREHGILLQNHGYVKHHNNDRRKPPIIDAALSLWNGL